jgi:ribosomal protein S18 acetylase RimI-like enzyme
MTEAGFAFRPACREDATTLAELVNYAGEGLPHYLWSRMTQPGQSAWDVGRQRAQRDEGSFSYRNATLIECAGQVAGCLIGYDVHDDPPPIDADMPGMFVPLQELENLAPGTWYVNVLAVLPEFRYRGFGSALLRVADEAGQARSKSGMSVIVSDANGGARRLYERHGYRELARRPKVKEQWVNHGVEWVLLTKRN